MMANRTKALDTLTREELGLLGASIVARRAG
jgi:hypothetical protein